MFSKDLGSSFSRAIKSSIVKIFFLLLASNIASSLVYAQETTVFGPRVYERFNGSPVVETDTFTAVNPGSNYTLKINNGGLIDDTYELVSSSVIYFNGVELLSPNELNQHVSYIEKVVTLQAVNEISVEVRGKPGGALVIGIYGIDLNEAPIANNQSISINEDAATSITLTATDVNTDPLSYQLVTQPTQGALTGTAPNLSYTPNANYNGIDSFTFKANDGLLDSAIATVNINVAAVNDAPVTTSQNLQTTEKTPVNVILSGTDIDVDTLTYRVVTQPGNGVLSGLAPNLTYTPNTGFNGSDNFTFVANDGIADSTVSTISVSVSPVNDAPVATAQTITTAEETAAGIVLSGSDIDGDVLTYSVSTQPANGVISGIAPNLTYTPNANFSGTDSFTFVANDGIVTSTAAAVSITVTAANDAPIATAQTITTAEDTATSIVLSGSDIDGDILTYSVSTQPANGVISGVAPNLTYTPNVNFSGSDAFSFVANDGIVASAAAVVSITVSASNDAPVATAQTITTTEDAAASIILSGSDIDGDVLTYSVSTQPANGVITGIAPNLTYTPNANFSGTDSFTFVANDGLVASAAATVSIAVTATNDAPVVIAQAITTVEDTAANIVLSGSDIDGDVLTYSVSTQPANGVISGVAPNLTYTPNANFSGTDSFTFVANDGLVASAVATVSITISAANDAPIASAQSITTNEDIVTSIVLSGSDVDGDTLTYSVSTQPANGLLTGVTPNLTYTPIANFNGADSFTFTVSDGVLTSSVETISITVIAINDAPVATELSGISTPEDTAVNITLSATDIEGDSLTYQVVNQPTNGSITGVAPNLSYTPNLNFNGSDSFNYLVNDGIADSISVTVLITVAATNDTPIATAQSIITNEDVAIGVALSGSDIDGDALTYSVSIQPANGVLSGVLPNLTYTPNANFNGVDSFSFVVNDGVLNSAAASVSLTINAVNDAPVSTAQSVTINEDTVAVFVLAGSDLDGDSLTYQIVAQPVSGVISGVAPNLIYTPNASMNGSDSFTYLVNDGLLDSATVTVSITVLPINDAPVANAQVISGSEDVAKNITLFGTDVDADSLTYRVVTQPLHGVLSGVSPFLTYTPDANFNDSDSFTFVANDGLLDSASATISLNILAVNDKPVAIEKTYSTNEGAVLPVILEASDIDGDALTYRIVTQPVNGVLSGVAPNLTYTPNAGFFGADTFTYVANDGVADSVSVSVFITVISLNNAPVANGQFVVTDEDTPVAIILTGTDADADPITYMLVDQPTQGSLTGVVPNLIYTPATKFNGADSFSFVANDGEVNSALATVDITINSVNETPVINSQPVLFAIENKPYQYQIDATDPDGDVLIYTVNSTATGLLFDQATLSIVWDSPVLGSYPVTITVDDGNGLSVQQIFTLQVISPEPEVTTKGTEFWVAYLPTNGYMEYALYVSSSVQVNFTVEIPGIGYQTFHTVTANSTTTVDLTVPLKGNENYSLKYGKHNNGVVITADAPVSVTAANLSVATTDASIIYPTSALGKNYQVTSWADYSTIFTSGRGNAANEVGMLATENNTTVTIIPTIDIFDDWSQTNIKPSGVPFSLILNRGETYQLSALGGGYEMSGTTIVADKPIAVFSGDVCAATSAPACDHLYEQTPAIDSWGTEYLTLPLAEKVNGDIFRVYASQDNSYIWVNEEIVANLSKGSFYEITLDAPGKINSNKPIMVAQIETSRVLGGSGDPSMINVPPVGQYISDYNLTTDVHVSRDNFVNIISPNNSIDSVLVDGVSTNAASWISIGETDFSGLQLKVNPSSHSITSNNDIGVIVYGRDPDYLFESYGYTGGMSFTNNRQAQSLSLLASTQNPVAGEQLCLTAQVIDVNNKPVTHSQITFYRQVGAVNRIYTELTDKTGVAEFCYTAGEAGVEHFNVIIQTITQTLSVNWQPNAGAVNKAPVILSLPVMHTLPGQPYNYQVIAHDPNLDALQYALIESPPGMAIDMFTGLISWLTINSLDEEWVTVQVTDSQGASTNQRYRLSNIPGSNRFPNFTSTPETRLMTGRNYTYKLTSSDTDNVIYDDSKIDEPVYSLISGPLGLTFNIDTLSWLPTAADVGAHEVTVQVTDTAGDFTQQTFTLNVELNLSPQFTSLPITAAIEAHSYFYKFSAVDDNSDALSYSMLEGPVGMKLEPTTPYLSWSPGTVQVGAHRVVVQADDSFGGVSTQEFTIIVDANQAPVFNTQPLQTAKTGFNYSYRAQATDPDGDSLISKYALKSGPLGMALVNDALGADLRWTPTENQSGIHQVVIEVNDGFGAWVTYSFEIIVEQNQSPVITSIPVTSGITAHFYAYLPTASDPESGSNLAFSLTSGPAGMTMNYANQLTWTPTDQQSGNHSVTIQAADSQGAFAQQTFQLAITKNSAPTFTSQPALGAKVGVQYRYDAIATDADNDGVFFELPAGNPAGFSHPLTNIFIWTPTVEQVGKHTITVDAVDYKNARTSQTFEVTVIDTALAFTSYPEAPVIFNDELFSFNLLAIHPDDLPLSYALTLAPTGLTVNAATGELNWTPAFAQIGVHNVTATVTDGLGLTDSVSFTIEVAENTNQAPVIESLPVTSALIDTPYSYAVSASDVENHAISYSLTLAPATMIVNAAGLISWTPTSVDAGDHAVTVRATDERSRFIEQSYVITVQTANQKPVINGIPATSAAVAYEYHQRMTVTDPDGDALNYAVLSAPAGFTVDSVTGNVLWTPTVDQAGQHIVSVQVDDGAAFIAVSWTIMVSDVLVPIELFVNVDPQFIQQGEVTTLTVISNGGVAQADVAVFVDGLPLELDLQGKAILDGSIIGRHNIEVTSTDGVNSESYSTYYSVADPTDITPPTVEIISPIGGAVVTAPTDITVTVADNNIAEVIMAYSKVGSGEFVELYKGADLFSNQVIATFDPTMLMNGMYHIVLQATDVNGQISNTAIPIVVEGDLKVGNFSITLEDIDIPLAGIPIRVTRTYDSRRRSEQLDFGYGWSIDYQNVKVEESNEPSEGWYQETKNLLFKFDGSTLSFAATCTYPKASKLVTVTLPNGDVEKFSVHADPANASQESAADPDCHLVADRYFSLNFTAEPGTYSTLNSNDGVSLYLTDTTGGNLTFLGETAASPITRYTLTTREGYVYNLNQNFGIETVVDPNGIILTYSESGITHSGGKNISFVRDRDGRITSITDASGTLVSYVYNSLGDLTTSTDALINSTTYTYTQGHALEEIVDPLQRRLVRNIYDLDGRLIAQEDNDGVRTNFNHDVAGRVSIVTNRRGYSTSYIYDDRGNVLSETDALLNTTSYIFDADDNQLSKTNALGKTSTATYNAEGDQLTQVDELLNSVVFTYNKYGQELTVTDASLNTFTNTYDIYGNLQNITDPAGNVASNIINGYGSPTQVTNTLGYQTNYTRDLDGNKLTETDALGNITTYTYDENNNPLTETRSRSVNGLPVSETTSYTYDKINHLVSTTNALNQTTSHEYDAAGNKARDIDAEGRITEYTYDAYNRLTRTDYPDTSFSASTYDAEGNKLTDTDRTGYVTTYVYDELNRLVQTIYHDTTSTHIEYDAVGRVKAEIDANNNRTEFEYDDAGRRTLTRDALLKETSFTYDAEGNLLTQTDANFNTTTFEYDNLDNRVKTIYPDLSESTQVYDAMGQVTSRSDQKLKTTAYAYDALGRLNEVTDALLGITSYTYDEAGNKLTQTDAELRTTSWAYDALGREVSRTLPLQQSDSSNYDVHGNLQSHTDFNGQVSSYVYDDNNRVTRIDYNDLTAETFVYDFEGRRTSATDRQNQTQSWLYDNRGRLTLDTKANGDTLAYGHDNAGNRTSLTVTPLNGTAAVTAYGFDILNRLETVTAPGILVTSYTYDNVGNRASVTYPNSNITNYVYDKLNRLKQQSTTSGLTTLTDFQYVLDASGHRTKITEANGRVTDYTYDDLYRLKTENILDAVNGNYSASYDYDKVGNRIYSTIDGVQTLFTYDLNDRLTQQGGTSYSYDENGNTLTETLDLNVKTFSYDAKNHMVSSDQVGVTSSYGYDVDGLRVEKTEGAVSTSFLVDLNRDYGQVLKETTATSTVDYTYGDDLISQSRGGNLSYYLYDGLGSTRALSDVNGGVTDTYNYEAFGDALNQTGTTENNYRFTGEQYDATLDNYYLRARYYNQNSGRFTQQDTYMGVNSDPVTLHKYLYANVDPVNNIDPSGNFSIGSLMTAVNTAGTLSTIAQASYSVFQIATGEQEVPTAREAGTAILMSLIFRGATSANMIKKFKNFKGMMSKKSIKEIESSCFDNSFVGGTFVYSKNGLMPIDEIKIGDLVLSYNEISGKNEYKAVTHLIQNEKDDDFVILKFGDNKYIESTSDHPYFVKGEWKDARTLLSGFELKGIDSLVHIDSLSTKEGSQKVYNITVDGNHNYYVGEDSVLVHNAKPCPFFVLPKTVRSASGVAGNFSIKGYSFRIDTNRISANEGFHVHIYKGRTEIAKITSRGGWLPMHGGKPLSAKPSTVPSIIRQEINKLVKHVNRNG